MKANLVKFMVVVFLAVGQMSCDRTESLSSEPAFIQQNTGPRAGSKSLPGLAFETVDQGFFQMKKPRNWTLTTAGQCSLFAFILRDPENPVNQIFYFSSVGPVYMSPQQKQIDADYMRMGGYPVQWFEMPVIAPLTPENFLMNWHLIASTDIARQFIGQPPSLKKMKIIHSSPMVSPMAGNGIRTSLIRGIFESNGLCGEGLFSLTTAPTIPFMNGPGGGVGYGFMVAGISYSQPQFKFYQADLLACLKSFTLSDGYVRQCLQTQQEIYQGIMKAGSTLQETSDMIMESWQQRTKTHNMLAEKYSDTILSKERLYDPDTKEVYQFDSGFYDKYRLNAQQFNKPGLVPLPDGQADLWNRPVSDGYQHVRRQ